MHLCVFGALLIARSLEASCYDEVRTIQALLALPLVNDDVVDTSSPSSADNAACGSSAENFILD
jgi:hypothetical protein